MRGSGIVHGSKFFGFDVKPCYGAGEWADPRFLTLVHYYKIFRVRCLCGFAPILAGDIEIRYFGGYQQREQ